jgi:hypothetical protein
VDRRAHPSSTEPAYVPLRHQRRSRGIRRAAVAVLTAIIGLGLVGLLGPRVQKVSTTSGSLRVSVTYASVTRPGLATTWTVEVRRPGGFDAKVAVATTAEYFEGFDFNALYPEPSATFNDGDLVVFEFDPPTGDVLRVRFDGRATPTWTLWRAATTRVTSPGLPSASVSYRTVFLP